MANGPRHEKAQLAVIWSKARQTTTQRQLRSDLISQNLFMRGEFHFPFFRLQVARAHKWLPALALSHSFDIEKSTICNDDINLIKRLAMDKQELQQQRNDKNVCCRSCSVNDDTAFQVMEKSFQTAVY